MVSRKSQKEQTKTRLRQAAMACFAEQGFKETQIADITRAAGVATGTFYVHFKSKEEILTKELQYFNTSLAEKFSQLDLGGVYPDAANKNLTDLSQYQPILEQIAGIFLDHWQSNHAFVRAYSEIAGSSTTIENLRDGINPPMENFVHSLLGTVLASFSPSTSPQRLHLVTQAILAIWLRLGLQYVFGPQVNRQEVVGTLVYGTIGLVQNSIKNA